jgi:hypothetical protein
MDRLYDAMRLENSVDDGNVLSRDLVDGDVANLVARVRWVDEEKEIPAMERWFHRATISIRRAEAFSMRVGGRGCSSRKGSTHLRTTTIGDSVFVINPRPL